MIKSYSWICVLSLICSLGLGLWQWNSAKVSHGAAFGFQHAHCIGYAAQATMSFSASVRLHERFVPRNESIETFARSAVREQLKFVAANFENTDDIRHMSASFEDPKISILEIRRAVYPNAMSIDSPLLDDAVAPYTRLAIAEGRTTAGDPGFEVRYAVNQRIFICGDKDFSKRSVDLALPADPYLAYWYVDASARRELTWYKAKNKINPCVDDEFADIPDPQYYWYFWRPERTFSDPRAFNCATELVSDNKVERVPALILKSESSERIYDIDVQRWASQKQIDIGIVFGWNDTQTDRRGDIPYITRLLESGNLTLNGLALDHSSQDILNFIHQLRTVFTIDKRQIDIKSDHLRVQIVGRYNDSEKPVRFNIYWGPTDALGTVEPKHWQFIADSLVHDDMVIYSGHAGLGENMNLRKFGLSVDGGTKKYQVIAILSCNSVAYFNPELFAAPLTEGRRDIIYTASSPKQFSSVVIAFTEALQQGLSTRASSRFNIAEDSVVDELFVVYSQAGKGS